jgi:hypothetical protein
MARLRYGRAIIPIRKHRPSVYSITDSEQIRLPVQCSVILDGSSLVCVGVACTESLASGWTHTSPLIRAPNRPWWLSTKGRRSPGEIP